jgi:hypothetical protein
MSQDESQSGVDGYACHFESGLHATLCCEPPQSKNGYQKRKPPLEANFEQRCQ